MEFYLVPIQKSGKSRFQGIKNLILCSQRLRSDDRRQSLNEHMLIMVVFGHTSPCAGEKIYDKLYFYANCLRASVSKLADTMEAHT